MTDSSPQPASAPRADQRVGVGQEPVGLLVENPANGLGSQAATGILWTTSQKWLLRVAGLVTLAILTRLVTPEEFGVVAAAMTVLPFFYLLSDLGFSTYLIQSQRLDQEVLSTGLWFSLAASLVLSATTFIAAPLMSMVMHIDGLTPVLRVLSISVLLSALAAVPTALLRRRLAFRALAIQGVVAAAAAQVVAVVLALGGFGVWSLVLQLLVMQAIALVLAWHSARWTPALSFSLPLFRSMAAFGARVSAAEFIAASRAWAEAAIVASMLGASALGYLNIAQRLVAIVQELSAAAIMPVSIVVFARIRDTTERLRRGYLRALSVGYAAVTPLLTVVAVTAPALIPLLFGDQWDASVPLAQALAIAAILTLGAMLDQGLLYGVGRPGTWLRYAVAIDALTVAVTAVAVHRGLTAVAVGFVAVALVATAARWIMVSRIVESPVTVIARPLLITATTAAVSGGLGTVVFAAFSADAPLLVQVAVTAVVVGLASLVLVRLCQRGVASYALQIMPVPVSVKTVARRLLALPSSDPVRAA